MHKAWSGVGEVPYCFSSHPSNFKVTRADKETIFNRIERFRTVNRVWIHRWLWNDALSLKCHRIGALFSRSSVKFQGHTHTKNRRFESNLSKITWQVRAAAIKSPKFALFINNLWIGHTISTHSFMIETDDFFRFVTSVEGICRGIWNSHIWQSLSLRDWRWKVAVTLGWMGATFSGSSSWPPRSTASATLCRELRSSRWEMIREIYING